MFKHSYKGVSESGDFSPIPEANYQLVINDTEEKTTKKGYPMINVETEIADGEYKGRKIWHNVCFLPADNPGAGISKHWLKVIGEPFEDDVEVDCKNWKNRTFNAKIGIESYPKDGKDKYKNIIQDVILKENDEVPF